MEQYSLTPALDRLILDLRQSNFQSPTELIDRAAYYLHVLKNRANIPLLLRELIYSPSVLGSGLDPELISHLIDAIHFSIDRKLRVTDPTIPADIWVEHVIHFCRNIEPSEQWRTLPVYAALVKQINAKQLLIGSYPRSKYAKNCEQVLLGFGDALQSSWPTDDDGKRWLTVFCLARSEPELELLPANTNIDTEDLLKSGLEFLYQSPYGILQTTLQTMKPGTQSLSNTYFSGYSFLIRDLLIARPISLSAISNFLQVILDFTEELSNAVRSSDVDLSFQKSCLFGALIQLDGLATLILQKLPISASIELTKTVLKILQNFHYITIEIGQAGFDQYNYIYYLCIDVLLSNRSPLDQYFGDLKQRSFDQDSRLIFLFDLVENILPGLSDVCLKDEVLTFLQAYLTPLPNYHGKYGRELLESAHSAMIKLISRRPAFVSSGADSEYFETAFSLFPDVFNSRQFKVAAIHVAESMSDTRLDDFLESLFQRCKGEIPGIGLSELEAKSIDYVQHLANESSPPTTRAALIGIFLAVIPLSTPRSFAYWLQHLGSLIRPPLLYNSLVEKEHQFLYQATWKMISEELSPELQGIGIPWWYAHLNPANRL